MVAFFRAANPGSVLGPLQLFLFAVAALLIALSIWRLWNNRKTRFGSDSGERWNVLATFDNHAAAAALMERLNIDVMKLFHHLKKKYHVDWDAAALADSKVPIAHEDVFRHDQLAIVDALLDDYDFEHLAENMPRSSEDTSYTLRKGESMHLCLRDGADRTKLVEYPILVYVMLHELSHIANYNDYGHTDRFWTVFKFIMQEAVEAGIYLPKNYGLYPENYCRLNVQYSPYFDDTLPQLFVPESELRAAIRERRRVG